MPVPQQSNSERIAGILSRARQAPPQRPDPFSGIAPRPAWEGAAGLPQPGARPPPASDPWAEGLRWGREEEGFPADSDNAPLDRSALARLQGETAEQDYSPLGPEWGWLDPLAGLATAGVKAGADSLMQPFDEGARDRTQQRREYLQGAGIGALDFDLGNSGDQDWNAQSDFWADREGAENFGDWVLGRPGQERRADMRQTQSDLDARSQGVAVLPDVVVEGTDVGIGRSVGAAASDFWRGPSEAARASRRDAVTGFAMEDALREAGDEEGAAAYQRQARRSAAADSFITGAGALELAPGMGLVDTALGAGRFGARQIIRGVAGREAEIPAHLTPRDWSPTEAFAGRPDEAMHDPGLLTRASERWRLPTAVTAVGAVAADQAMDGDFGDPLQLAGGAAITAGALRAAPRLIEGAGDIAGRALGRGEDPLADIAPRVADDAPRSFEGAPRQTGDVIDAEAAPVQSERRTINLPQPFAGAADVTVNPSREELAAMIARQPEGESVKWGVDSNGDLLAWENGQAVSHGMVTGQPSREGGGFQVHGTLEDPLEIDVALLTASRMRNEGPTRYSADDFANELGISPETAQTMLERDGRLGWPAYGDRETVGVGEQVNRDGRVTPRDPINWDAPQTRLPADDEWFANLSGTQAPTRMNIVSEGGVPGRSADDMLRSAPDGGRAREGFDTDRVVYRGLGRPYDAADGGYYQSFTSSLDDAQEYGSNVIAAHIRPGRNLAIDGGGNNFNSLSVQQLPADVRARLHPGVGDAATTDQIAHAAREAGYDSVTVRNVHDNRWGERPGRNTEARTIDFVFDTKNISPLDNVPTQPPRAEAAAERVRLSEADRALLAELEDFPGSTLPPLRAHEGSWIGTSQTGEVREFFNQANAQKALDAGWTVRTAGDHLANLNRNGPNAGSAQTGQRAYEAQLQADGFDVSAPLYHGTGRNFDEFALGQPETTFGADNSSAIYLTSKPHIADAYAGSIDDNLLAHRQNIDPDWAPHVRQVYVRDSNPLVLSDRDYSWLKQGDAVRTGRARDRYSVDRGQRAWESIFPGEAPPAEGTYFEALRQRGFTSVRMESGDEIAVFDPANIRPRFGPTRAQPNAGRRLGDDPISTVAPYVAAGGGAGALLYADNAEAGNGGEGDSGDPLLPILGGGILGVATLEALRRGRLGQGSRSRVGMFAGVNARTADHAALARAQEMATSGASRETIWQETGWFQGVDGKWRFEIDDSGAGVAMPPRAPYVSELATQYARENFGVNSIIDLPLNDVRRQEAMQWAQMRAPSVADQRAQSWPLNDVLDHPEMRAAYGMDDVTFGREMEAGLQGSYSPTARRVRAIDEPAWLGGPEADPRSTVLHEVQHYTQETEGFARGGDPRGVYDNEITRLNARMSALVNEQDTMRSIINGGNTGVDVEPYRVRLEEVKREYRDLMRQREALTTPEARRDGYTRLAGETEARNVQTRRDFTPEERRARPPWETQDVPDDQQIVRFDGDRAESRPRRVGEDPLENISEPRPPGSEGIFASAGPIPSRRRLGQDPVNELNDVGAQSANAPRTEADISREWPTDPEQWREVMGTHPWINSPSRAQMVLMMSARDESGRFLYNAEQIAAAAHLASPESMNVLANRAREAGVPIPPRPKGGGGATRMPGGDRLNRAVEVLESAVRSGEPMTWSTLDRRMGIADGSSRSWLATALNNPAVPQKLKDRIRAAINANPRTLGPRRNDPIDAIAPIGIGAGATALAFSDDAEAQDAEVLSDGRMIDPNMPDIDLAEGEWQGEWSRTNLADGSEALMRAIIGPDGEEYTIIGVQSRSGEIDFLGTVEPTEGPPGPYDPVGDVYEHAYDNVLSEPYEPPARERGEQPDWLRPTLAVGAGLAMRGLVGRGAGRGTQDAVTGVTAFGVDAALGGDWTESVPVGMTAWGGARGADIALDAIARRASTNARDAALRADPAFRAERDAFAATLPDDLPTARVMETQNYHGEIQRPEEGLFGAEPIVIPDSEMAEQGYSFNRPVESMPTQREQFLQAFPAQQRAWMDEAARNQRQPSTGQIGFASGIDDTAEPRPPPPPPPPANPEALDDIAPMPRQYRATPEDIMENPDRGTLASPARHAQSLATIAEEYGVEVARGARGGVNGKRTAANLARAARTNPALQAELRRRGLWAAVLTGGAAAAGSAGDDPLAGVAN